MLQLFALVNDVLVYLDDILIFSRRTEEHVQHVRQVLQRLLDNKLFVNAEKCRFNASSVAFLGYILESGQVKTDPNKIQAVVEWPRLTSQKQLQQFLGFDHFYRRFIRDYSHFSAPLIKLTFPFPGLLKLKLLLVISRSV